MKRYFLLLCVLVLFALISEAHAATYYVATNGVDIGRSCATATNITTPKLTIMNAVLCLTPGDTLYVRSGTYAEQLYCPSSGSGAAYVCIPSGTSFAAPVTVSAYPSETVIIQPAPGNPGRTINFQQTQQYIILQNFILDGVNVGFDNVQIADTAHHIRIQNNEMKNALGNGINLGPSTNAIEILNNHIHHNGTDQFEHGVYVASANNIVSGNTIHHQASYGVHVYSATGSGANNNIVIKNHVYQNGLFLPSNSAGILLSSGTGNIAYNNLSWGNPYGIRVDYGVSGALVYSNTVYANTASQGQIGIYVGTGSTGATIRNNILYQNGTNYVNSGTGTTQSNNLGISSTPDPLFVDAAAQDFRIQSGSPARDAGFTLGPPYNVDFDGNARPQGSAYDIGASEFVSGGSIYYVATTGGLDSRNCNTATTITTPKQTISNAVLCLTPGDTLYVRAGTYAETLYCPSSGSGTGFVCIPSGTSYSAPVTVSAYPSEVVTIRPTSGLRLMNFDQGQHHIIIKDFVLDGVNVDYQTIQLDHAPHHIRIQNNEIKNSHGNGVNIGPDTDSIEVLNNHIHDIQAGPISPFVTNGIYVQSNNNLVSGNSIHHCAGYGIHIYNGFSGDSANNNVITKNITYSNGTYTPSNVAGILIGSGSGNIASNNISYSNPIGIRVGYGPTVNNLVYGNTVYGNTASQGQIGIYVADGSGAIVRNNIMYLNGTNYVNSGTSTTQSNNLGVSSSPDPLFVNAGSANFHIQSGSPARDTGFTLGAPYNVDFDGNARPQGSAYDIGAYEFTTASAPAAPTSPTATPGNTQVTVGWTASAGATSYSVFRSTVNGGSYSVVVTGDTASPYVDTGLTNGTTYYYVIQAVNASGSSPNSTQTSATPQPPITSAPTGLIATAGDTQVSLAWTATAGAVTYNVLRSTTSGSGYAQIISGLTSPSYLNTGLTNTVTYYYVVQAVNASGTSPNSAQAGATPSTPPPPIAAPPTNFMATSGDTQVSLSWTASATADTYTVKRGTVDGGPYGTTVISALATTSHVDTGRTNGTTYYYVVTAVNGGGESGNSTQASATPNIAVPAAPTALTPAAGDTQVTLTWTAAAGATSYSVYKATVTGGPYGAAVATGITATTYDVLGLTNTTPYFFVVTAVNTGGESVLSTEVSATPQPAVPAAPTGLGVTASAQQITLSWSAVAGADIYTVSRAVASGGAFTLIATGITNLTYSDFEAYNGIPYYYVITATNINGTSLSSAEINATARVPAALHVIGTTATTGRVLTR